LLSDVTLDSQRMMQHVGGASAYSVEGTGASGKWSHPETVAVDGRILPLNSRTLVYGAGRYSGEYTVEDTGGKVDATKLTWYMPGRAESKGVRPAAC
jgi:3D (Asp-Asp-Asp) domain-containing protein